MKIGIFDSGLGGLIITRAIRQHLPQYDLLYLGDTLHVPYGGRSGQAVYAYTQAAIEYLFAQECQLIIIACNTASAAALRLLQQQYLPKNYPQRRILGVIIPTLETALATSHSRIGLLATTSTVRSNIYADELQKMNPQIQLFAQPAPLLVPLIENSGVKWSLPILEEYLQPLLQEKIESMILGCTHYPYLKSQIRELLGDTVQLISQDEIIPEKLVDYLRRHPEIESKLAKSGQAHFCVTDLTDNYIQTAKDIYGQTINLEKVIL